MLFQKKTQDKKNVIFDNDLFFEYYSLNLKTPYELKSFSKRSTLLL